MEEPVSRLNDRDREVIRCTKNSKHRPCNGLSTESPSQGAITLLPKGKPCSISLLTRTHRTLPLNSPQKAKTMQKLIAQYRLAPSHHRAAKVMAYRDKHPFAELLLDEADRQTLRSLAGEV